MMIVQGERFLPPFSHVPGGWLMRELIATLVEETENICLNTKHGATGAGFGKCICHHATAQVPSITDHTKTYIKSNVWLIVSWNATGGLIYFLGEGKAQRKWFYVWFLIARGLMFISYFRQKRGTYRQSTENWQLKLDEVVIESSCSETFKYVYGRILWKAWAMAECQVKRLGLDQHTDSIT